MSYVDRYYRWLQYDQLDDHLKQELQKLTDHKEIEDRFYRDLEFGTAGLRGIIGAGTNRMNVYTIRKATYGFAQYLLKTYSDAKQRGVAVAYDSRYFSKEFAQEAAIQFALCGLKVYMYRQLRPTPMLSYAVRHLGAVGGVMITASHNPPEYNGYKVYNHEGCQITEKAASLILEEIQKVKDELSLPTHPFNDLIREKQIEYISESLEQSYYEHVLNLLKNKDLIHTNGSNLTLVFTPLHGTANEPVQQLFSEIGISNVHYVSEQQLPDPSFSTVKLPNPEDPSVFKLALQIAKKVHADCILATDPDADRLGVMIRDDHDDYQLLTGNQIGALLLQYILEQLKNSNALQPNNVVIKSIVTSDIGTQICQSYNVQMEETLTGFKYIGERIEQYTQTGEKQFIFGYEESYGYLHGPFVRDKDAIQIALLVAEMVLYYKQQGLTLIDLLQRIYDQYGYYEEKLLSFTFPGKVGMERMRSLMEHLRQSTFDDFAGVPVLEKKDYVYGIDGLPPADVIKYWLENGWIVFRPSGTEPKLKCYISVWASSQQEAKSLSRLIEEHIHTLI